MTGILTVKTFIASAIGEKKEAIEPLLSVVGLADGKEVNNISNISLGEIFSINLEINPGEINRQGANLYSHGMSGVNIEILDNEYFQLVRVEDSTNNNADFLDNRIKVPPITYNGDQFNENLISKDKFQYKIYLKALKKEAEEIDIASMFKLHYKKVTVNSSKDRFEESEAEKPSIGKLGEVKISLVGLNYNSAKITLNNIAEEKIYMTGEEIPLIYTINPGDLSKEIIKENNLSSNRKLVYLIDESIIDEKGTNDEIAKESIMRALDNLSEENYDSKSYLITYGKTAKVVYNDNKKSFSIEELKREVLKLEQGEKGSNLGDALRKVATLIKEEKGDFSVVLVSGYSPLYYSVNDNKMVTELSMKDYEQEFSDTKATEYAQDIVKEISNTKELSDIKWYGISYGVKDNDNGSNEIIKLLDGTVEEMIPNAENIEKISKEASAAITIKGSLYIKQATGADEIEVINGAATEVDFSYRKEGDKFAPIEQNKNIKASIKIGKEGTFDLASSLNLVVKYIAEINGGTVEFELEQSEQVNVETKIAYESKIGLYNGKKIDDETSMDINELTTKYLGVERKEVSLAVDNYFGIGIFLDVKSEIEIEKIKFINGEIASDELLTFESGFRIKKIEQSGIEEISIETQKLTPGMYFIKLNCNIQTKEEGKVFEVGVGINPTLIDGIKKYQNKIIMNVTTSELPKHY